MGNQDPGWEGMDPKESMSAAQALTVAAGDSISTNGAPSPNDPVDAPGPLPLLGAGAAFAYSRRLRKRIMLVRKKAV
jgi:MYXO-CTERM domain-containing protein